MPQSKPMPKQPPMYKQYRALKAAHPQALLLYRLGDFYELFEDDAKVAAQALGLTLTQRRFAKGLKLPMAGFPYRYVNSYVARLINKGFMVAVADQLEDSRFSKGLVKRGVTRVVTSGTVMDEAMLKPDRENFLLGLAAAADDRLGLACLELSTGDFQATCLPYRDLFEEIERIHPSEVVLMPPLDEDPKFAEALHNLGAARLSPLETALSAAEQSRILQTQFQVASLEAFGSDPGALSAAAAVLHYLQSNQLSNLSHITRLSTYQLPSFLTLDTITRRNLELTRTIRERKAEGSLLPCLDTTQTRMGARLLQRWLNQPLAEQTQIEARLDAVEHLLHTAFQRSDIRDTLKGMYDLERIAGRLGYGNANARDLIHLKHSLQRVPTLRQLLQNTNNEATPSRLLQDLHTKLDPLTGLADLIDTAIEDEPPILLTEGGLIKTGFDTQLDTLRGQADEGRAWLQHFEAAERERTGIKNLRLKYNSVFGFFIEVTKSNIGRVPAEYERRQTVAAGERFTTPELKAREQQILKTEDQAKQREYDLFQNIRSSAISHLPSLSQTARAIAQVDVLAGFAELAAQHNYCRPQLSDEPILRLRNCRHPVVEQQLHPDTPFVPNHCQLDPEQRLLVLTGPNMSGKSVYLRQVALAVLMAQMGCFVAATEAEIGLSDRIFVRAGASDDISQGRSTFLVEMSETAHILHHAGERSLVILDEVGRGTSTYDGLSLAWAVAEEIYHGPQARCLFATHFHELTELGRQLPAAKNMSMAVREENGHITFLRQLIPGGADRSYGIHVAHLAGLPPHVLARAQELLQGLEMQNDTSLPPGSETVSTETRAVSSLAETKTTYITTSPREEIDPEIWQLLQDLYDTDVANLTPIEALIRLHRWQQTLKSRFSPQGETAP